MRTANNIHELVDIRDVRVDKNMSRNERVSEYNRQIKDSNRYKCGAIKINAFFNKNGEPIEKCLTSIVTS
jgi:hypothetical protein